MRLAAAAAATFDEDTICSSDASEEGKTAEERLAARDEARAANDFVDAAADGEQVRPPLQPTSIAEHGEEASPPRPRLPSARHAHPVLLRMAATSASHALLASRRPP